MNFKNLHKRAQSLPLNTIVIAILVVIVLLIIIVTFTDSFTGSNDSLNDASGCSSTNPLVSLNYEGTPYWDTDERSQGDERVTGIPSRVNNNDETEYCYAQPKN